MRVMPKRSEALSGLLYLSPASRAVDCTLLLEPSTLIVLEASRTCESVLGLPVEKIVGRVLPTLSESSCREDLERALHLASRRTCPRQFGSRWRIDGGRIIQVVLLACPMGISDDRMVLQVQARQAVDRSGERWFDRAHRQSSYVSDHYASDLRQASARLGR